MSYNPLSETTEFIKNKIDELIFTNLISEKLGNLLILDDPVISNFRILPKRDQMILTDINKIIF